MIFRICERAKNAFNHYICDDCILYRFSNKKQRLKIKHRSALNGAFQKPNREST